MIVRLAQPADAQPMCDILNAIIAIGGTTAYETPFTTTTMTENYIASPNLIACHVADDGVVVGFQAIWHRVDGNVPVGWGNIATFAKPGRTQRGIGSALIAATKSVAFAAGIRTINATIRADNVGGLAYYSRQGFRDYDLLKAVPLSDGRLVDRVRKRLDL